MAIVEESSMHVMKNMAKNKLTSLLLRNEVVTPSTLTLNQLVDELTIFKHNNICFRKHLYTFVCKLRI